MCLFAYRVGAGKGLQVEYDCNYSMFRYTAREVGLPNRRTGENKEAKAVREGS